jgi:spore germination protein GerM
VSAGVRGVVAAVAAVVALVGAACGIDPEDGAQVADPESVPFGLLGDDDAASTNAEVRVTDRRVEVYYLRDGELEGVNRLLADEATLAQLVTVLAEGPSDSESASGLRSALPAGGATGEVTTARGTATVDLAEAFTLAGQEDQAAAIAQLVYTLTARPGIGRVAFTLDGEAVEVPRGDGTLTTDALTRDDFPDRDADDP